MSQSPSPVASPNTSPPSSPSVYYSSLKPDNVDELTAQFNRLWLDDHPHVGNYPVVQLVQSQHESYHRPTYFRGRLFTEEQRITHRTLYRQPHPAYLLPPPPPTTVNRSLREPPPWRPTPELPPDERETLITLPLSRSVNPSPPNELLSLRNPSVRRDLALGLVSPLDIRGNWLAAIDPRLPISIRNLVRTAFLNDVSWNRIALMATMPPSEEEETFLSELGVPDTPPRLPTPPLQSYTIIANSLEISRIEDTASVMDLDPPSAPPSPDPHSGGHWIEYSANTPHPPFEIEEEGEIKRLAYVQYGLDGDEPVYMGTNGKRQTIYARRLYALPHTYIHDPPVDDGDLTLLLEDYPFNPSIQIALFAIGDPTLLADVYRFRSMENKLAGLRRAQDHLQHIFDNVQIRLHNARVRALCAERNDIRTRLVKAKARQRLQCELDYLAGQGLFPGVVAPSHHLPTHPNDILVYAVAPVHPNPPPSAPLPIIPRLTDYTANDAPRGSPSHMPQPHEPRDTSSTSVISSRYIRTGLRPSAR